LEIFNMKKTLVALAAVAATGGAFAQATMTGALGFGYQSDTTSGNVTTSGMGVDDAEINFAVSESIEGLGTISGKLGFGSSGNGSGATGNDTAISIKGASGASMTVSNTKGGNYLSNGLAGAGTDYQYDMAGKLFSVKTRNDVISFKFPVAEGTTISLAHAEGNSIATTTTTTATGYGAGAGASGADTTPEQQRYNTLSVDYAAGPLAVNAGYRSYDNVATSSNSHASTRTRASLSYDLGAAKIGAGLEQQTYAYGNTRTDSLVGINVPMSRALNLGAQFANRSTTKDSTTTGYSGYLLVANYSLSKQTYLVANYYSYQTAASNATGYGMFLYKGF